jgi:hypothetical protein
MLLRSNYAPRSDPFRTSLQQCTCTFPSTFAAQMESRPLCSSRVDEELGIPFLALLSCCLRWYADLTEKIPFWCNSMLNNNWFQLYLPGSLICLQHPPHRTPHSTYRYSSCLHSVTLVHPLSVSLCVREVYFLPLFSLQLHDLPFFTW